ncbi:MAG TPA: SurA N-terminal domain-containing protein [Burkholderiaceae bacterium]|nr:SurA N-terminal domain-containing protein [Burkholderiaceae bacterium]
MFDWIRKHQRVSLLILLLLILPAFVFFGVAGYDRMRGGDDSVATVAGNPITQREFELAQRRQIDNLRQMFGDQIDARMFDTPEARRETLEGLITQRVIATEAARQRLHVSEERLAETIRAIPGLQRPDGSFDVERYRTLLSAQGMTPQGFEVQLLTDLRTQMLPEAVQMSALLPQSVRERLISLQEERREIRELRFSPEDFAAQVQPTPEEIRKFYEDNVRLFEKPESVDIEYVVLSRDALAATIELAEADLRKYFEQNRHRFGAAEERRASHVLLTGPGSRDKAQQLLAELRQNPERFAEVAKAHSQDPGSAEQGGDLGFFNRQMMVKPFADAAFALREGEISEPVESEFGVHLIKVTEVRPGAQKTFDEVRAQVENELRSQLAVQRYPQAAETFTNMVYEQSDSLKPVAERFKLPIQTAQGITRSGDASRPRTEPVNNPRLLASLFGEEAVKRRRNTDAVEVASGTLASARVVEHRPAQRLPLEQVEADVRERLVAQRARELAREAGQAALAKLRAGEGEPGTFAPAREVTRVDPQGLPPPAVDAVFRMPAQKLPSYAGVELPGGGYAVYQLTKVIPASQEKIAERRAQYEEQLTRMTAQQELVTFLEALKARSQVVRHPERLRTGNDPR